MRAILATLPRRSALLLTLFSAFLACVLGFAGASTALAQEGEATPQPQPPPQQPQPSPNAPQGSQPVLEGESEEDRIEREAAANLYLTVACNKTRGVQWRLADAPPGRAVEVNIVVKRYDSIVEELASSDRFTVPNDGIISGYGPAYESEMAVWVTATLLGSGYGRQQAHKCQEPPGTGETATLSFELTVEGEPPPGTLFFIREATGPPQEGEAKGVLEELKDSDGDSRYTDSWVDVDKYPLIPRPIPPGTEPISVPISIVQGTEDREITRVIEDFGEVKLDGDKTLKASVSFSGNGGGSDNNGGGADNNGGSSGGGVITPVGNVVSGLLAGRLPDTGGGWTILLIAGAILIALGWLVVRLARRLAAR
jgi:LPXTG-motif cell wall-anchored protein